MKFIACIFLVIPLLSACTLKHEAPANMKAPIYYKVEVSDSQMTDDLNDCALAAFKASVESQVEFDSTLTQKTCMRAKGYEISYN